MKCPVCENSCALEEGNTGRCGLYVNHGGRVLERYPDRYLIISPITIETMPMLHYRPGGKFLQISTVGCNFDCPGCISTVLVREMGEGPACVQERRPDEIVREAADKQCLGICFLMNDPLASLPTFVNVARKAKESGLLVGCSSNAYFTENSLAQLLPYIDFINVGMKGFSDSAYRRCGAGSAGPVWRNIEKLHGKGVHVEISCMYRKGEEEDMVSLARRMADISPTIPLQVMRFIPLEDANPALESTISEAENICLVLSEHLRYVYLFNSPGTGCLTTHCPECGEWIIKRDFYGPMGARLKSSRVSEDDRTRCALCGTPVPVQGGGIGERTGLFREPDFQGGYPFTRALEILESIAIATGVRDRGTVVEVWNEYARQDALERLHHIVQVPDDFVTLVRSIGRSIGRPEEASRLADHLETALMAIREKSATIERKPLVYYAIGKPLFCIKGGRMENQLVEIAGGISANKKLKIEGRPGESISVEQLNNLNPEVIFISAFISSPVDDFREECLRSGIRVDAVKNGRIHVHPAPGWDFGSPRWVLGLMHIANVLHPEVFTFDVLTEARMFYRKFYDVPFSEDDINRSFGKPSSTWRFTREK